jgi:hypothetical protein
MKASFDLITVRQFGIPKGYYWILSYKKDDDSQAINHACKVMPTEQQAWDDLAIFMANLIEEVKKNANN